MGGLEDGTLTSKPTSLEERKIPINWIVRGEGLTPMEGINVSLGTIEKVWEVSTMVQENGEFLASFLKDKADENSLGISVDPRLYLPNSKYYLETNDENSSIVTPVENPENLEEKTITTYISTTLDSETKCESKCQKGLDGSHIYLGHRTKNLSNPITMKCYQVCAFLSNGKHVLVHGTPINTDTSPHSAKVKCYQVCAPLKSGKHLVSHVKMAP